MNDIWWMVWDITAMLCALRLGWIVWLADEIENSDLTDVD